MPRETAAKHRVLLSLRSEKALGLRNVLGKPRKGNIAPTAVSATKAVKSVESNIEINSRPVKTRGAVAGNAAVQAPVEVRSPDRLGASVNSKPATVAGKAVVPSSATTAGVMGVGFPTTDFAEITVLPTAVKRVVLSQLDAEQVKGCVRCELSATRTQTVFGEGDVDAPIFFIGEGPGETEDQTGRPFVGRAGQLLDKMIAAMGLSREQVFIANIVKCRPPNNRVPAPEEVAACTPYLLKQLETIHPKVIVSLGLPATKYMMNNSRITMGSVRGKWQSWRGLKLMPTYHPSYILRVYTEETRQTVWGDLQQVMNELGLKKPK